MYAAYLAFMHSWFARTLEKAAAYGIIAVFGTASLAGAVMTAFGAPLPPPPAAGVQLPPPGPRKDCPCNPCNCSDCQSGGCALPKGK